MLVNPVDTRSALSPGSGRDTPSLDALAMGTGTWVLYPYRDEEPQ